MDAYDYPAPSVTQVERKNQFLTETPADIQLAQMFPLMAGLELVEPWREFLLTHCKLSQPTFTQATADSNRLSL